MQIDRHRLGLTGHDAEVLDIEVVVLGDARHALKRDALDAQLVPVDTQRLCRGRRDGAQDQQA